MNKSVLILSIRNCDIGYHSGQKSTVLLENLNLDLGASNLIALIGLNGSGKSSLLKSIVKLMDSLKGEILLSEKNILDYTNAELAGIIAYVTANWQPEENMTVEELIRLGRYPYTNLFGMLSEEDLSIVEDSIEKLSLSQIRSRPLSEISDGERQRAMLARVFAQKTKVIVLDEPTAFLDVQHKYEMIGRLRALCDSGITVIFSTHDIQLASYFADRFWLIQDKKILEGAPEDIFMSGSMSTLFSSPNLKFDLNMGDYLPVIKIKESIGLKYDKLHSLEAKWTQKALNRVGYSISEEVIDGAFVHILKKNHKLLWNLHRGEEIFECKSILDLLDKL